MTRSFAPVLEDIVDGFTEWWMVNKDLIEQNIPKWVDSLTKAINLMTIAFGAWLAMRILTHVMTLITLMKGLTVATLAANAAFFLLPLLLGALALAFVALVEDAKVFFEGGESFIGDMLKKYPQWIDEINTVASVLATVYDLTIDIFDGWSKIFDLFDGTAWEDIKEVFSNIPGFLGDVTGLNTVEGTGLIPETQEAASSAYNTAVEKIDIIVQGGADTAENIANRVYEVFQQTYQDLNSAVDQ